MIWCLESLPHIFYPLHTPSKTFHGVLQLTHALATRCKQIILKFPQSLRTSGKDNLPPEASHRPAMHINCLWKPRVACTPGGQTTSYVCHQLVVHKLSLNEVSRDACNIELLMFVHQIVCCQEERHLNRSALLQLFCEEIAQTFHFRGLPILHCATGC